MKLFCVTNVSISAQHSVGEKRSDRWTATVDHLVKTSVFR
jgi:hypothetical protein